MKPNKILAMHIHFGHLNGKTCRDCCHLKCHRWNGKNYYKCQVYGESASEATDWRLYYPACGAWNDVELTKRDLYKDIWHAAKERKDATPLEGQIRMDL